MIAKQYTLSSLLYKCVPVITTLSQHSFKPLNIFFRLVKSLIKQFYQTGDEKHQVPVAMKPVKTLRGVLVHPKNKQRKKEITDCVYEIPSAK